MDVCALDYRYGRMEMKTLFSESGRIQRYLDVEAAIVWAHSEVGNAPKEAAEEVARIAKADIVTPKRVNEIEAEIRHDIMALVKAMSEQCEGDAGKYIHLGATSNDIIDTANGLQIRDGLDIIRKDIQAQIETLLKLAEKHRNTIMLGRTHGQPATPITFGLKLTVFASEMGRHLERLSECHKRAAVGKLMGAVGTGAALGDQAFDIQRKVMDRLGLGTVDACTQLIGRDIYIEVAALLANIATSQEKFATEVRNLQRPELGEAFEAFDAEKQVGSSTMAHKKNPITSENVCGLARIVRGFLHPTFDNNILWHERDLANSAGERFILPHIFVLTDDIVPKMTKVFANLAVSPENMKANIERTRGLIMAEAVMMALARKGMDRQKAHEVIRKASMRAEAEKLTLKEALAALEDVTGLLSQEELDSAMEPANYTGRSGDIIDTVKARLLLGGLGK